MARYTKIMESLTRRRLLQTSVSAASISLVGCSGNVDKGDGGGTEEPETSERNGTPVRNETGTQESNTNLDFSVEQWLYQGGAQLTGIHEKQIGPKGPVEVSQISKFRDFSPYAGICLGDNVFYIGSFSGSTRGISAKDGELIWKYGTGTPQPQYLEGTLFISNHNQLHSVEITENKDWSHSRNWVVSTSSYPVIDTEGIYFSSGSGVYKLNFDGEVVFRSRAPAEQGFREYRPVVSEGMIFAIDRDNTLHAIDSIEERMVWSTSVNSPWIAAPRPTAQHSMALYDGLLFVSGREVFAIDPLTGEVQWNFNQPKERFGPPAVSEGRMYFSSTDGFLYALDTANGDQIWSVPISSGYTPKFADNVLYLSSNNVLIALDPADGSQIWQYEHNWKLIRPTIYNGMVVVASIRPDSTEVTGDLLLIRDR